MYIYTYIDLHIHHAVVEVAGSRPRKVARITPYTRAGDVQETQVVVDEVEQRSAYRFSELRAPRFS
jgi:hypothetical protein